MVDHRAHMNQWPGDQQFLRPHHNDAGQLLTGSAADQGAFPHVSFAACVRGALVASLQKQNHRKKKLRC